MGIFGDLFGNQGLKNVKQEAQFGQNTLQEGIAQLVRNLGEAGQVGAQWDERTLSELLKEYGRRREDLTGGTASAQQYLQSGYDRAAQAERDRYAQQLGLTREGMAMDRATLSGFLNQMLGATGGASGAYGQLISASLPNILGALSGTGRMPTSASAQLQLEDTARRERAAMQRQGLEGSGMATAREAAARRRVLAEDEQNQYARMLQALTMGLGGQQQAAQNLQPYAQMMGGLGARLQQVTPMNLANIYERQATGQSNLAQGLGTSLAGLQSGVPQQTSQMGTNAVQNLYNQANARFMAPQAASQFAMQMSQLQPPSTLSKIGSFASTLNSLSSLFGS